MIRTLDALRALYAQPGERAVRKQLDRLDVHCTQFIALSPFCVIGSAGPQGELLDASPRSVPTASACPRKTAAPGSIT